MEGLLYRTATPSAADPSEYVLSDETVDRYGEVIAADGWDLRHFRNNPVALFNHNDDAIIGRWDKVRVEGKRLLGRLTLAAAGTSQIVDEARRLWDQKLLRAVSVGFRAIKKEPLAKDADEDDPFFMGPYRYLKSELVEASLVAVPANPNALQIARSFELSADIKRQLFGKPASEGRRSMVPVFRVPAKPLVGVTSMKTPLAKQIENQQLEITALRDQLTELTQIEERDEEQEALFEALPETIKAAQKNLTTLQNVERALATGVAEPHDERADPSGGNHAIIVQPDPKRPFALPKKKIEPADYTFRAIVCGIRAFTEQVPLEQALRQLYGTDEATGIILRAAVNPAMTTVAGWAQELVQTANADFLDRLIADSIYGPLSGMGARYDLGRNGSIKIPTRQNTPKAAGAWVGEGAPKPVKRIGLSALTLTPHKLAVISTFTEEMAMYSVPAIEGLLRQAMADDTAESLDGFLIDNVAGSPTRPAGLLNGVTPITASALTPATAAMVADLKAIVGAIVAAGGGRNIAILINSAQAMAIGLSTTTTGDFLFESTDAAGRKFNSRFIISRSVPAGTVIGVDAADFATVTGDAPRFAVSNEATLHEEDTTPLALATGPQGTAVVASPMRSLFQTDSLAIRLSLYLTWGMRRTGMVATITGVIW
jgi:HK97 family phage major capsid protein/HK97 family phage prohead protease